MANISYDNPASLAPKIGFEPNGFLGGMWSGQRNADYTQAIQQSNLMKALGAKEEMNKLNDYEQNAPVRDSERLAKIAGYQNDVKYKGDIMAGQAATGRKTAAMITPEMENTLAQYRANNSQWKQQEIDRQAQAMNLFGESIGWSPDSNSPQLPGHDTLEGQLSRDQLLKKFKEQYPDLGLPDAWGPDTENKLFQRYQIARTLKNIKQKDELAKTELQKQADLQAKQLTAASNEKIQAAHDEARITAARTASERAQTLEKRLDQLMEQKFTKPQTWTPQNESHLQAIQRERDLALAAKAAALGVTTGIMGGGQVTPGQLGTDAAGIVQGARQAGAARAPQIIQYDADGNRVTQ